MVMIQIIDNGEPLVNLKVVPNIFIKLNNPGEAYARKTVANMLKESTEYLPSNYNLQVRSAWRDKKEQERLLGLAEVRFKKLHPNWSAKRIQEEIYKYVAPVEGPDASGHLCGAALDLRLLKNGKVLPMRSSRLSFQENAQSHQILLPRYIRKNRAIMHSALEKAGFANLDEEFWHFSYGDYEWAKKTGNKLAIYGVTGLNKK